MDSSHDADPRLSSRVAALAVRSAEREQAKSSRLRSDAESSGFLDFYRAFKGTFGDGVRILHCDNGRGDSYGTPQPRGIPFSDPPPARKVKRA